MKLAKALLFGAMALGALTVTGCGLIGCGIMTPRAAPQPGVSTFQAQAALSLNDFNTLTAQTETLFIAAHNTKLVDDQTFVAGEKILRQVVTDAQSATMLLASGASQSTILGQLHALGVQVAAMPAAFSIKDPATQAEFTSLITSLNLFLTSTINYTQATP